MYKELQLLTERYNEALLVHTQKIEWIRRKVKQRIAVYVRPVEAKPTRLLYTNSVYDGGDNFLQADSVVL